MVKYLIDTSALMKRYKVEKGSEKIKELFEESENEKIIISIVIVEILHNFYRLHREGEITEIELQKLTSTFYNDINKEIIKVYDVRKVHALKSKPFIKKAQSMKVIKRRTGPVDTLIIACALDFKDLNLIFVSSDLDLNQPAKQENIQVLNPEEK
ncbi:MAG: type II toxin-antitoxin system VapC family toxin [bacterium]